jgi:sugar O-acyltransferase (sialic acid O-acetyltransferase NeuD family)
MEDLVIVGFGGHAKSVADCIERMGIYRIAGYTDLEDRHSRYKYLGNDSELKSIFDRGVKNAVVGIGYLGKGTVRNKLYDLLKSIGYNLPVIKDPSAIISDSAIIGEGAFIGKAVIVNSEASIGKMAIINTKALVEHECKVGEFTHIAVGAVLCGQVIVGDLVLVGANATVIQCRRIESNSIVPAGVVVGDMIKLGGV